MKFKQDYCSVLFALTCIFIYSPTLLGDTPVGWAVVPGKGVESTTGGGNGNIVIARSVSELKTFAARDEPLVIAVTDKLTGDGMISINSNKTIIGQGANAILVGLGLSAKGKSNIIIRNLKITGVKEDAIATRHSHHVWIDHCDLSECGDGLLDITRQSDYHTVSWTRFSNHRKTLLINSGTDHPEDVGTLNTTLHHNWFDGSHTRNPRVGYGKVHVFNCLYNNNNYGIGLHSKCLVRAERNYFKNTKSPVRQMYRPDPADRHHGFCQSIDNVFDNCSGSQDCEDISFPADDYYMYEFMMDRTEDIPDLVKTKAGPSAEYGKIEPMPIPGNGAINVSDTPTLKWTKSPTAAGYILYFGQCQSTGTLIEPPKVYSGTGRTYKPGKLETDKIYYWRVDQITPEGTQAGQLWRFKVK